eukprot:MONOS_6722.1-p1 / transcript=MONOS_6722.1 / gene=MONOS_6722 / organism=Monocercomonoides_exilis_PA203 / gene_product=transmembrane nine protein 6 / transcript_product=transmembrane nine protein 6 / location=Mono_scaffold00216:86579-88774(-) / protein_length=684 / sequence_SO=supercontig / SO=protein_coding / is_pseudo=false
MEQVSTRETWNLLGDSLKPSTSVGLSYSFSSIPHCERSETTKTSLYNIFGLLAFHSKFDSTAFQFEKKSEPQFYNVKCTDNKGIDKPFLFTLSQKSVLFLINKIRSGYTYNLFLSGIPVAIRENGTLDIPLGYFKDEKCYYFNHFDFLFTWKENATPFQSLDDLVFVQVIPRSISNSVSYFTSPQTTSVASLENPIPLYMDPSKELEAPFTYTVTNKHDTTHTSRSNHYPKPYGSKRMSEIDFSLINVIPSIIVTIILEVIVVFLVRSITKQELKKQSQNIPKERTTGSSSLKSTQQSSSTSSSSSSLGGPFSIASTSLPSEPTPFSASSASSDQTATLDDVSMEISMMIEEKGWKQLCNEVFRRPKNSAFLSSNVAAGLHTIAFSLLAVILSLLGLLNWNDRTSSAPTLVIFISSIAIHVIVGFAAGRLLKMFNHANQSWSLLGRKLLFRHPFNTILVSALLPLLLIFIGEAILLVAGTGLAPSFFTLGFLALAYLLFSYGAILLGEANGFKKPAITPPNNITTNTIPRLIPPRPWYATFPASYMITGLAPMATLIAPLCAIFRGWTPVSGGDIVLLFLSFVVLPVLASASISILFVFLQLSSEDHSWCWRAFHYPASSAAYVAILSLVFLLRVKALAGPSSFFYFLARMGIVCVVVYQMCGCAGFLGTLWFVRKIYGTLRRN